MEPHTNTKKKANIRHAASVIVVDNDHVLLVRRSTPDLKVIWSFPGGKVQREETNAAAARRELAEETGLAVNELLFVGFHHVPVPTPSKGGQVTIFKIAVHAAKFAGGEPVAGDDAEDARFIAFNDLKNYPLTDHADDWLKRAIDTIIGL